MTDLMAELQRSLREHRDRRAPVCRRRLGAARREMMAKKDPAAERREAALDVIRHSDQVRELSNAGRATVADVHALAAANDRLAASVTDDDDGQR